MTYDQAQSPRLGQRTPVESTYIRMFSGDEIPEAAWPGQIIYRNETQTLQIYNGNAWEDVVGGIAGQLTFVGDTPPLAQHIGDIWFDSSDDNRLYVAASAGANEIAAGEWEVISSAVPPITPTTHIYQQDTAPGGSDVPPPKDNDFWYETPGNHQYYYKSTAPGTHWIGVRDAGIDQSLVSSVVEYSVNSSETVPPTTGWSTATPTRTPGSFIWVRTTVTRNDGSTSTTSPALLTGNTGSTGSTGPAGANAALVILTATSQVLVSPAAGGGTTPATATVTGETVNTTITVWEYSVNSAAFSATVPAGVSRSGNVVTITGSTMTAATIAVRMADANGIADTLTVSKVLNGATGTTGSPGADAYTVLLTNEAQVFAGSTSAALAGTATSQVIAFKAATQIAATIGTITGQVTGLTTAITNNGTTTAGFTVTVTTSLTTLSGVLTVPITADGVSFTKQFAWSLSLTGSTGATGSTGSTGPTGVSISSVVPYFAQVTTGSAAPAQPTTATPSAPWVATEPTYLAGTELYRVDKNVYSDATFNYTAVYKSSSYAAAVFAQTTADGKNKVTYSTSDPGTTANIAGDLWYTYAGTTVTKQWKGNGTTSWTQVLITGAVLTNLDAASITTNFLSAARIGVNTLTADKLVIGEGHNWIPNPGFEEGISAPHAAIGTATLTASNAQPVHSGTWSGVITIGTTRGVGSFGYEATFGGPVLDATGKHLSVKTGDVVYGELWVRSGSATGMSAAVYIDAISSTGTRLSNSADPGSQVSAVVSATYQKLSVKMTMPTGAAYASLNLAYANCTAGQTNIIDDAQLSKQVTGSLLVDGAMDAKLITGPTIQTATAGNRLVIRDDGSEGIIEFYTGVSGETKGQINPSVGALSQHQITFQTSAGTGPPTNAPGTMILSGGYSGGQPALGLSLTNLILDDAATGVGGGLFINRSGASRASISSAGAINSVSSITVSGGFALSGGGSINGAITNNTGITITGTDNTVRISTAPTTTVAANVRMNSSGDLLITTSLTQHKIDPKTMPLDRLWKLTEIPIVDWFDRNQFKANKRQKKGLRRVPGVLAEDVAAVDEAFASYGEDGELMGVQYDRLGLAALPLLAELRHRVEQLEKTGEQGNGS